MDAQAQDRAHRIGQTKPVLVYRIVSAHTIEDKILQRATEKKKLEVMVIAKGKFKKPAAQTSTVMTAAMIEMAADLLRLEVEKIDVVPDDDEDDVDDVTMERKSRQRQVLSDEHLRMLLDRRPEVFKKRGLGWDSSREKGGCSGGDGRECRQKAFAVYEMPGEQGNDALAALTGEDVTVD